MVRLCCFEFVKASRLSPKSCCFFENLAMNYFTFAALHSVNKFSNEQQILGLNLKNCPQNENSPLPIEYSCGRSTSETMWMNCQNWTNEHKCEKITKRFIGQFWQFIHILSEVDLPQEYSMPLPQSEISYHGWRTVSLLVCEQLVFLWQLFKKCDHWSNYFCWIRLKSGEI